MKLYIVYRGNYELSRESALECFLPKRDADYVGFNKQAAIKCYSNLAGWCSGMAKIFEMDVSNVAPVNQDENKDVYASKVARNMLKTINYTCNKSRHRLMIKDGKISLSFTSRTHIKGKYMLSIEESDSTFEMICSDFIKQNNITIPVTITIDGKKKLKYNHK